MKRIVPILLLMFLGCSKDLERSNLLDPNSPSFSGGIIEGRVIDISTGMNISGSQVSTEPATKTVTSNDTGNYQITGVKVGNYILKVSAPWFAQYTSGNFNVTSTQKFAMDIYMNPNIVFQDTFNTYTPALPPLNPPWVVNTTGGSAMVEVPPSPENFSSGCKLYSGTTAGGYVRITTNFLVSSPAFKVVCKMLVDSNNSAADKMRIKLLDTSGTPRIEFGFAAGATLGVKYLTSAVGPVTEYTAGLSAGNYYTFIIEADNGSNTVNFFVKDKNNNQLYTKNNIFIWSGPASNFGGFSAEIGCEVASANGYIDDITIIKK